MLSDLRSQFGSLYLAAAAYDGGDGRIARGLVRYANRLDGVEGEDRFFSLADTKFLRQETRDYVPKIIAAALVGKEPARYGVTVDSLPPLEYDTVRVPGATPLAAVAERGRRDRGRGARTQPAPAARHDSAGRLDVGARSCRHHRRLRRALRRARSRGALGARERDDEEGAVDGVDRAVARADGEAARLVQSEDRAPEERESRRGPVDRRSDPRDGACRRRRPESVARALSQAPEEAREEAREKKTASGGGLGHADTPADPAPKKALP